MGEGRRSVSALAVGLFRTCVWVGADSVGGAGGANDVTSGRQPPSFGLSSPVSNGGRVVVAVGVEFPVDRAGSVFPFSVEGTSISCTESENKLKGL